MKYDTHHLLWYRKEYSKGWAKRLRDHWYCRVSIPQKTLHREIHHQVEHIPVPRVISIKDALSQLEMLEHYGGIRGNDPIEKRLKVLMALFDCCEPEVYKALQKQLDICNSLH